MIKGLRISSMLNEGLLELSRRYDFSVRAIANKAIRRYKLWRGMNDCPDSVYFGDVAEGEELKAATKNVRPVIIRVETLGFPPYMCRMAIETYVNDHKDLPAPMPFVPDLKEGKDYLVED